MMSASAVTAKESRASIWLGYGRGLAADVVSVKGETRSERCSSSERMWKWIDAHGKEFGIVAIAQGMTTSLRATAAASR
jgi:hypothetical protein